MGQDVDGLKTVLFPAARGDLVAEHRFLAEIVHEGREHKLRIGGIPNRPTRKTPRNRNHVVLGIAAFRAQGMEFHHLAAVILVESVRDSRQGRRDDRIRHSIEVAAVRRERPYVNPSGSHGLPVVEIVEHGGMSRGGQQHILEVAKNVGADGIALVAPDQHMDQVIRLGDVLIQVHIEVVEPEIHQHFFQLPVGIQRAKNFGLFQILAHDLPGYLLEISLAAQFGKGGHNLHREQVGHRGALFRVKIREQRGELLLIAVPSNGHLVGTQKIFQARIAPPVFLLGFLLALLPCFLSFLLVLRCVLQHIWI